MSTAAVRGVVRHLGLDADPPTDAALLTRYARHRDEEAFAELLHRHGPVVLGVCRRVLAHQHDAEDAFQAVFLVLARKADAVRPPGSVGNWLYGVAVRTASKARVAAARRWRRERARAMASGQASGRQASGGCEPAVSEMDRADLRAVIDDELGRLPDSLRAAVVLCDLGGKTRAEAARELGWPEGTVAARNGITLNRLAYTDGKALWARTWLEGASAGVAQFGPLAMAPKVEGSPPAGVAYSPDGKRLVFIPNYKVDPARPLGKPDPVKATHWIAQVWGGGSGEAMLVIPHGTDPVTAVAWSPDGKLIAANSDDGTLTIWDGVTFEELRRGTFVGRDGGPTLFHGLAFAPDGRTLAAAVTLGSGKATERVILIDPEKAEWGGNAFPPLGLTVRSVAWSPDGKRLIGACGIDRAKVKPLMTPDEMKAAGAVVVWER